MTPRLRYFSIHDAINYWVLVGEVFRSDEEEVAHQKGLDELEISYRPIDRIFTYKFPATLLQKNFQGIKRTDPLTMREVRELVRDYFSHSNAQERLQSANNLYRFGDFRACAEKLYIEQKGRQIKQSQADYVRDEQRPESVAYADRAGEAHRTRMAEEIQMLTRFPDAVASQEMQNTPGNGFEHSSPVIRRQASTPSDRTASQQKRRSDSSASETSSVDNDRRTSIALVSMDNHKKRKLACVDRESVPSSEPDIAARTTPVSRNSTYSIPSIVKHKEQLFAEVSKVNIPLPGTICSGPPERSMDSAPTTANQSKNLIDNGTDYAAEHVSTHPTQPIENGNPGNVADVASVHQGLVTRAAALKATKSIRSSYRPHDGENDDDVDEVSSVDSSEPPIKHQWTEENNKKLDLGECRFCGGFYSRIQGGGLTKHEVYWCVNNPDRRDRMRWDQRSPRPRSRAAVDQVDQVVQTVQDTTHPNVPRTRVILSERSTHPVTGLDSASSSIEAIRARHNPARSQAVQAQSEISLPSSESTTVSLVASSNPSAKVIENGPLVAAVLETTVQVPIQVASPSTKNATAHPKILPEDWEMVEMYMTSGSPAEEIIEMVDETLQASKASSTQPFHAKAFVRYLLHSADTAQQIERMACVLKYFETVKLAGVLSRIDASTFKAMLYLCEKKPHLTELREVMQAYLSLFVPGPKLKTWQFLSRLEGGVALVKRFRAVTS
ncbi:protein of unknown function [Taphrina deformans PYCC 5710]|uniref:Uncharacterized protein n=1 Tax=Taphrina deformans (strain PYCC 5710 / ATCC 11124 / CBS 356.35 / IMI 108563 / JCM 9778 / NBRC 8474) TaxID=1097556 RepID=R4X7H0_TAPDE|nr:protein of unknown function [Taphrina deformans PYCC 5710]|eukprot:CCG81351.1 protein of unknown function [Taphrina deformans PYCC 5710]